MADSVGTKVPIKERGMHNVLMKLEKSIEEGDTYAALQMYKTLYFRYTREKKWDELKQMLVRGAKLFLQKGDINSGSDLANLLIEVYTKTSTTPNDETIQPILDIFALYKHDNHPSKRQFVRAAVAWSSNKSNRDQGDAKLHAAFARSYRLAQEWNIAQRHFIRSNIPAEFAEMILEWAKEDPKEDVELLVVRAVLLFLCLAHTEEGNQFFNKIKTLKSDLATPIINFADLLLQTVAKEDSYPTFDLLRQKYAPSLERDPSMKQYLDHIAFVYYGVKKPEAGGLGGMLNSLMQGFLTNNDQ